MEKDKELYKEFVLGSDLAFEKIMDKYISCVILFVQNYVKRLEIAEEIAQDTFVYLLLNKTDYDFKYSLKTYLFTIAKCRALNYLKREKIYDYNEEIYNKNAYIEPLSEVESNIDAKLALKKLPKDYQAAIYLADVEKLEYKEICKVLNKTLPQVKMLIHRARRKLKEIVMKEGLYDR